MEGLPSAVVTVMRTVLVSVSSEASTVAVRVWASTKVVGRLRLSQCTVEPLPNPVPLTVRVEVAPPRARESGSKSVMLGQPETPQIWKR